MTRPDPSPPRAPNSPAARAARLKDALRANLHRRKAQARARDPEADAAPHPDAAPPQKPQGHDNE
jgi:hypothetical protein